MASYVLIRKQNGADVRLLFEPARMGTSTQVRSTKSPANVPGSSGVFPPRRNEYFAPAEMSIAAVLNREN
jgi:hypothetical protein